MKHTRSFALALLLSLSPAGLITPAFAEGTADDATTLAARARFREGVEAYEGNQFESARASFLQAYALRRHPDVLFNLAWSCLKSGHPIDADKYFQQFLREAQNVAPAKRAEAEKGLAEARTKIARIDVIATAGTEVWLDGERLGTAPLNESLVTVEPGAHTVKFKHADGTTDSQSVTAVSGEKVIARPTKANAEDETAAKPAKRHEKAPKAEPVAAPVEESAPDTQAAPTEEPPVVIEHRPKKRRHAAPPPGESGGVFGLDPSWPFYVLGVGALAAVGTGVGFIAVRQSANNNAQKANDLIQGSDAVKTYGSAGICANSAALSAYSGLGTACNALTSDRNAASTDLTVGAIAFGAGALFAAGTIIYAVAGPKAENGERPATTSSFKFTPSVSPSYSGLSFSGSF